MPLYEYQCEACGHRFEKIQKFSDPLVDICPVCGGFVRKLISSPAFQFKGTGFYITDYPKKDQGGTDKSDKSDGGSAAKATTSDSTGKAEKGEKAATPAASEKSASTPSTSSSSGSKDSSSSSTSKTST